MILVSACLLGTDCRYDGGNCFNEKLNKLLKNYQIKAICPEVASNLTVPRSPAEIKNGNGECVLKGKAKVITREGIDVSKHFLCGARKVLQGLDIEEIDFAILKERSPSCGVKEIYNGEFNKTLRKGSGVSTAYLLSKGVTVYSEVDIYEIEKKLRDIV